MLVESTVGARAAADRDDDDGVGGNGVGGGGEVVDSGDVIRVGTEESGDGGRGVVERWF